MQNRWTPIGDLAELQDTLRRENRIKAENQLLQQALEAAANAVMITDSQGHIEYVNRGFEDLTGYRRQEVLGETPRLLRSGFHGPEFYQHLWTTISSGRVLRADIINRRQDGSCYEAAQTITPVREGDRVVRYIAIQEDVTERRRVEARVEFQAYHDALTGLPNRALLLDRISQALRSARREGGLVALLLFDLDRFKAINDSFGHEAGDTLLLQAAQRIQNLVREADTLARLGGDEFALLLSGDIRQPVDPATLAARICESVAEPFQIGNVEVFTSASLGIAIGPRDGDTTDELMKAADLAMYRAKEDGRNTYRFFSGELQASALERMILGSDLRHCTERGQLSIHLQPQVSLADGRPVACEALMRWQHPVRGLLQPAQFISLAEENGSIVAMGGWVLEQACRLGAELERRGLDLTRISVNLSLAQFLPHDLVDRVQRALGDSGLPAEKLELEVHEQVLTRGSGEIREQMQELAELGVRFCLDDFGTGHSSLVNLAEYPIHRLKIPQEFVIPATQNHTLVTLIETITSMAKALGKDLVAEGIETEAHLEILKQAGCSYGQGYLFARPMPAESLSEWWRQRSRQSPEASQTPSAR